MATLTADTLIKKKDWRELYLRHGADMLALAATLLASSNDESVELGLRIVADSFFEEDDENRDARPALASLDFGAVAKPLGALLTRAEWAPRAAYGLLVCCREMTPIGVDAESLRPLLEKSTAKVKWHGHSVRAIALRLQVHGHGQRGTLAALLPELKADAALRKWLFDELAFFACSTYDASAFLPLAMDKLQGKSQSGVTEAVVTLWNLLKLGTDVSAAIPFLVEHQSRLGMSTDAVWVIAGHYLKTAQTEALKAWLDDTDPKASARAYRGLSMASKGGIDAHGFVALEGMRDRLDRLSTQHRLMSVDEFLAPW